MAKRQGATLARGTTFLDYASPAKILAAFENDMRKIRAEYSRQRSIIRKRVERMEKAGEIYNPYYERYGRNRDLALPTVKNLSDADLLLMLSSTARGISGGYQATVSEIRESRADTLGALKAQAEAAGDEDLAEALSKGLSAKQLSQVGRIMGMIKRVVGKTEDSDTVRQFAMRVVLGKRKGESLLSMAARTMDLLGVGDDEEGSPSNLEALKERYTTKGTVRVSWKKAHSKRGD